MEPRIKDGARTTGWGGCTVEAICAAQIKAADTASFYIGLFIPSGGNCEMNEMCNDEQY